MAGQGSQVKKSCACCKRYMDHLHGKMTCFLMPMSANYRHSMTMPARFMNQFGGELSESMDIESPDGSVYAVKGTKYMNKMLPQSGWKTFVDAHPIEENDSLLFQHIEKARFKVLIIDPDGCEKNFPCDWIRISSSNIQEKRDMDYVDVTDSSHDRTNKLSRVLKRVSSCQGDCPRQHRKAARITTALASSSKESGPDSEGTAEYKCFSGFDDDPKANAAPDYVLSRKSILSEEQEDQVVGVVKEIQPEITVFVAVMKPSNVQPYPSLVIPKGFAAVHFPQRSQVVTLQWPGKNKKWHTKLDVRKDAHVFRGLWSEFVQDNHLQEGDICIFQPLKTTGIRFTLMVHLIRQPKVGALSEHGKSPSSGGTSSSRGRTTMSKENDDRRNCFFKVMSGDFRSRMIIPNKFARCFGDKILGKIKLKACNGCSCTVVVTRYRDKLVLEAGWEAFVSTHDIRLCDLLVFRYNGNFQFEVLIFDPSCCVKESSNVAGNICDHVPRRHVDLNDNLSDSDSDHKPMQSPGSVELNNQCTKINRNSSTCDLNASGCADISSSKDDQEISSATKYIFPPSMHLTQMQRMKVEKRVQDVCSSTPIFGCVMTKCNITRKPCYLSFCRKYAHQYLPSENQILRLQRHGKVWKVLFRITKRNSMWLCHGWKEFVGDNKLQIGDICLFELLKNQKMLTMNIHTIWK